MSLVAVFVDAGYLFAQGSVALTGSKKERSDLDLNVSEAVAELTTIAHAKSANASLLRIYWYDGAILRTGLTPEHEKLAYTDFVKLRLGSLNRVGQQKGVDSLIVTDLIDLARNRAISDAVLVSGDEDVRVAVQITQSFGVRVHLIGITPCRGSQSLSLLQEADTTTEWDVATVKKFLSVKPSSLTGLRAAIVTGVEEVPVHVVQTVPTTILSSSIETELGSVALDILSELLSMSDIDSVIAECSEHIPTIIHGRLLARSRDRIGRLLSAQEKHYVRQCFMAALENKYTNPTSHDAL